MSAIHTALSPSLDDTASSLPPLTVTQNPEGEGSPLAAVSPVTFTPSAQPFSLTAQMRESRERRRSSLQLGVTQRAAGHLDTALLRRASLSSAQNSNSLPNSARDVPLQPQLTSEVAHPVSGAAFKAFDDEAAFGGPTLESVGTFASGATFSETANSYTFSTSGSGPVNGAAERRTSLVRMNVPPGPDDAGGRMGRRQTKQGSDSRPSLGGQGSSRRVSSNRFPEPPTKPQFMLGLGGSSSSSRGRSRSDASDAADGAASPAGLESVASGVGLRRRLSFEERRESALTRRASDFVKMITKNVSAQERLEEQLSRFEELHRQATQEDVRAECSDRWVIVMTTFRFVNRMLDCALRARAEKALQMMLSPLLLRRAIRRRRTRTLQQRLENGDFHGPTAHDLMKGSAIFSKWPADQVGALLEESASPLSLLPGMCIVYSGEQAKQTGMYIIVEGYLTEIPSTDDIDRYLESLPQALHPIKTGEETRARRKKRRLSMDAAALTAEKFTAPELFPTLFQPYVPPAVMISDVPIPVVTESGTADHGDNLASPTRHSPATISPIASFKTPGSPLNRQRSKKALNPFQIQVIANMATYNPGGVIGDEAVLLHRTYMRSVRCQTPVVAYYIPYKAVLDRLRMLQPKYQQEIMNSAKVHARNILSRLVRPTVEQLRAMHPIFSRWNSHSLLNLSQLMSPSVIRGGDRFVGDMYRCPKIFIVFSGEVLGDSNRSRQRLHFGPGSILCVESILMYMPPEGLGEEVSLIAGTFCELWTISRAEVMMSMQRNKIVVASQQDALVNSTPTIRRYATVEMVKHITLFAPLSDKIASNIAGTFTFRLTSPDEYLTLQGYPATEGFLLLHGIVKQVRVDEGDANPLAILKNAHNSSGAPTGVFAKGDVGREITQLFSGASFLFAEALLGAKQQSSSICVTSCVLLRANRQQILDILADKENKYCTLDDVLASARAVVDSRTVGFKISPPQEPLPNSIAERNKAITDAQQRANMRVDAFRALHGDLREWNESQNERHLTAVDISQMAKSREEAERAERFRRHRNELTKMTVENRIFASVSTQMFHVVRDAKEQERTEYFRNGVDEHLPEFYDDDDKSAWTKKKQQQVELAERARLEETTDAQIKNPAETAPVSHQLEAEAVASLPQISASHLPKPPTQINSLRGSVPDRRGGGGEHLSIAPYRRTNCGFTLDKSGQLVFTEVLDEPSPVAVRGKLPQASARLVPVQSGGSTTAIPPPAFARLQEEDEKRRRQSGRGGRQPMPVVIDPITVVNQLSRQVRPAERVAEKESRQIRDPSTRSLLTGKYSSRDADDDEAMILTMHRRVDVRIVDTPDMSTDVGVSNTAAADDDHATGAVELSDQRNDPTSARTMLNMIEALQPNGLHRGKSTMARLGLPSLVVEMSVAKKVLREDPVAALLESVGLKEPAIANLGPTSGNSVIFHVPADSAKLSLRRGLDFSRTATRLCNDAQRGDVFSSHFDKLLVNRQYTVVRPAGAQNKSGTVLTDRVVASDEEGPSGGVVEYESTGGSPRRSRGKPYIHAPSKDHVRMTRKEYYLKKPFKQLNHHAKAPPNPPSEPMCGGPADILEIHPVDEESFKLQEVALVRSAPTTTRRTTSTADINPLQHDDRGPFGEGNAKERDDDDDWDEEEEEEEEEHLEDDELYQGGHGDENRRISTRGTDDDESAAALHRMTPTTLDPAFT